MTSPNKNKIQKTNISTVFTQGRTTNLVKKQLYLMLSDENIDQNTYEYLYPKGHKIRTPHCYFLPKIHKITPADRVFVGGNIF